jgi:hypothetical protein
MNGITLKSRACAAPKLCFGTALILALSLVFGAGDASAKPRVTNLSLTPVITSLQVIDGQLLASGAVTTVIKGRTVTAPFSNVPVNISLAPNQAGAACPILDLSLAPINLDLLGLVVQTSPICLTLTAYENGGVLGNLLCGVANALNAGIPLGSILGSLDATQLTDLLTGLTGLLNGALANLTQAVLTAITTLAQQHTCAILHLELGPLNLTLLGLNVVLDNCANGPVTVDITGQTGQGNLLGNLLCELLDGGLLNLGATLQGILNQLLGTLTL